MLLTMERFEELYKMGIHHNSDGEFVYIPEKKLTKEEVESLLSFDKLHYISKGRHVRGIEKLTQ